MTERTLFELPPRDRPRRKLMHVADAGESCIQFACRHCGHKTDWQPWDNRVTEAKRGVPCPKCSPGQQAGATITPRRTP